jgi:hypothetical protein
VRPSRMLSLRGRNDFKAFLYQSMIKRLLCSRKECLKQFHACPL